MALTDVKEWFRLILKDHMYMHSPEQHMVAIRLMLETVKAEREDYARKKRRRKRQA